MSRRAASSRAVASSNGNGRDWPPLQRRVTGLCCQIVELPDLPKPAYAVLDRSGPSDIHGSGETATNKAVVYRKLNRQHPVLLLLSTAETPVTSYLCRKKP